MSAPRDRLERCLRATQWQATAVVAAVALVAALHAHNDGLWFQGDAPRHAMNGAFWWDLLRALPTDPLAFTVRYYARYPVISPATYPPLFYVLEGAAYQVFGQSAQTARLLVAASAILTGIYTMLWARRWISPLAGWCGALVAFVPGIVVWTNAVMLNIPATALGMASLYHLRAWLDTRHRRQLTFAIVFLAALLLTYYLGVIVIGVWVVLILMAPHQSTRGGRIVWVAVAGAAATLPVALAAILAPVQLARHAPGLQALLRPSTWTHYWSVLPQLLGVVVLVAAAAGLVSAWRAPGLRGEVRVLATWMAVLIMGISPFPAKDARYILLVVPAAVLAAGTGIAALFESRPPLRPGWQATLITVVFLAGLWSAGRVGVPQVSGFREIAEYIRGNAPTDTVLYDGNFDGVFGFYLRALDPAFESRFVRGNKLLYDYSPRTTFRQVEVSKVTSVENLVDTIRHKCGCRWVAVEVGPAASTLPTQQLLRRALQRPEFALVRSFPVDAPGIQRVDLYRVTVPVDRVDTVDLTFPAFSPRVFTHVSPITR